MIAQWIEYLDWTVLRIVALLIFVELFLGILVWTMTRPKSEMVRVSRLALEEE